jgi:hypothetical protein
VTPDRRLRIGAWAALLAAILGPFVILVALRFVDTAAAVASIAVAIQAGQSVALFVAIFGLRELLDHLSSGAARAVFVCGVIGSAANLAASLTWIVSGPSAFSRIEALVGHALIGVWIVGSAVAVGRGNGGRTAVLGWLAGIGLVSVVGLGLGILGPTLGSTLVGWDFTVQIAEMAYLILLWRFALAAVRADSAPGADSALAP